MFRAAPWLTLRRTGLGMCSALLVACGSNTPTIPAELLGQSSCDSADYAEGPYGTEEGDTVANLCFKGFREPSKSSHDQSALQDIAFSDYYDPTGSKGLELILIDTSAVWCSACRTEHEGLAAKNQQYAARGLRIVGTLFQDAKRDPASLKDLAAWVETFKSNFPMLLDPDYQLGAYAPADTAPLNLVVNARTMKIEKKLLGDQESILWPYIDDSLPK
ncbi:MAG: redoxin domain-containing protein [Pseudomonadota bacterium]